MARKYIEDQHQAALFSWARLMKGKLPGIHLMFHPPNGGKRGEREAGRLKKQGVLAGVSDIVLPVARGGYHGLFIELKSPTGALTKTQEDFLAGVTEQGYMGVVCFGFDEAKEEIIKYYASDLLV
ncbi:VRR-NUC domain-containing protein [bacterium]|nr:VRR-NUC domain-containing protein [bacterium]